MASPEPEVPRTRERRCPTCAGEQTTPTGHVLAAEGLIHVRHRCEACGSAFVVVRTPVS